MASSSLRLTWVWLLAVAGSAQAHVGGVPATARFLAPAGPVEGQPFTPAAGNGSYRLSWEDGDLDPTGRFSFVALTSQPHAQMAPEMLQAIGIPLRVVGGGEPQRWVSCSCDMDLGACTPRSGDECANTLDWDTSLLGPGAYWVVAINDDPPFLNWSTSDGPLLISSGSSPPAAGILRPDGRGVHDRSYEVVFWASGAPPLRFALWYGQSDPDTIDDPPVAIANDLTLSPGSDGLYRHAWDLSALPGPRAYYVRLQVTDGEGRTASTDSLNAIAVVHPIDAGLDLARTTSPPSSCEMSSTSSAWWPLAVALLMVLLSFRAAQRGRRRA